MVPGLPFTTSLPAARLLLQPPAPRFLSGPNPPCFCASGVPTRPWQLDVRQHAEHRAAPARCSAC
eukprot:5301982-Lingulodinium_polyedra.AAC.1